MKTKIVKNKNGSFSVFGNKDIFDNIPNAKQTAELIPTPKKKVKIGFKSIVEACNNELNVNNFKYEIKADYKKQEITLVMNYANRFCSTDLKKVLAFAEYQNLLFVMIDSKSLILWKK